MTTPSLAGCRILIVEDEPLIAMLIEDLLADTGCSLIGPAVRVVDALKILNQQVVDLVLLDVNLNGEQSYPVADELMRRGVPFVFTSGHGQADLRSGYTHHPTLTKPFDEREFIAVLAREALDRIPTQSP